MKKSLLTLLAILLVAVMAVALVACGGEEAKPTVNPADPKSDVGLYKADGFEKSTLKNQVSWEGINQFKSTKEIAELYKTDKATAIAEARQVAIDFFNYAKTATWIPADNWSFTHHDDGTGPDEMQGGQVYGGLPYVGLASSAIYRVMDFIDPETGVVDVLAAGGENHEIQKMFGNQCANGAYQGWSRFINSAKYSGTPRMTQLNNFIPVGDYKYPTATTTSWSTGYGTDECCKENGEQVIYASYAEMIKADGFVNFTTAGHVMMLVDTPVVVMDGDKIDGVASYCIITDQHVKFADYQHPDGGDKCLAANYINRKMTFKQLYDSGYVPFTYQEWLGEDPIEVPEYNCKISGDSITLDKLFSTKISSNYHIYDIYFSIYNADGVEVAKVATHNAGASDYELKFQKNGETSMIWGNLDKLDPANYEYTVKVYVQSGTGERPTLWEGKLAA